MPEKKDKTYVKKTRVVKKTRSKTKPSVQESNVNLVINELSIKTISDVRDKISYYADFMARMSVYIQDQKLRNIANTYNMDTFIAKHKTISVKLNKLAVECCDLSTPSSTVPSHITNLVQDANNDISALISVYGAPTLNDVFIICLGKTSDAMLQEYENEDEIQMRLKTLISHAHPTSYSVLNWSHTVRPVASVTPISKRLLVSDEDIIRMSLPFECFDLSRTMTDFFMQVNGVKISIPVNGGERNLIVFGYVDDVVLNVDETTTPISPRIKQVVAEMKQSFKTDGGLETAVTFNNYIHSLTIKDYLVFGPYELYQQYQYIMYQLKCNSGKEIVQLVNDFLGSDLHKQRTCLIALILGAKSPEEHYVAHMMYELLSVPGNGGAQSNSVIPIALNGIATGPPTSDQTTLYDSLPWNVKQCFRNTVNAAVLYANKINRIDMKQIPYEQQICLMKANDTVKEKAMIKFREIKAKSDDTASKARTYLDGLLNIPFGIFREEEVMRMSSKASTDYTELVTMLQSHDIMMHMTSGTPSSIEIRESLIPILSTIQELKFERIDAIKKQIYGDGKKSTIIAQVDALILLMGGKPLTQLLSTINIKMKISDIKTHVINFLVQCQSTTPDQFELLVLKFCPDAKFTITVDDVSALSHKYNAVVSGYDAIKQYMRNVRTTLDGSVCGHDKAKRQVERVIAQWINGSNCGYCLGFEGPPGVGKTSLAKHGISKCLVDEHGKCRPFAFIGVGGSANGSTFEGHNYTYVGASWGRIVSILMESKVSNPIIFIDEIDKVSRTEHGREIIGILTHLIDPTQNMSFNDKYFNGVDIDLSKVLFIFSYNDVSLIDRVLLDRIHRIKFECLEESEKVIIVRTQMLPELLANVGLDGAICIPDDVLRFIIKEYTCEAGVRKLKEILFEIVGEINLSLIQDETNEEITSHLKTSNGALTITTEHITNIYLKSRRPIREKMINPQPAIGVICGMWANGMGNGGIIQIEVREFLAAAHMELKLTGQQGDVMKESMTVAKTLAWDLLTDEQMSAAKLRMEKNGMRGLHIHCPEGAVPKDGPSAGAAITTVIYSILTGKRIKNALSLTGEICLQGNVTAIGGLDLKILGAMRAGVREVLFPKENIIDFDEFMAKHENDSGMELMKFHPVETIQEVFEHVFE